jgi:hypothetical protein
MTEPREVVDAYIREMLELQHQGERFTGAEHDRLIGYVDIGLLGMDGHKYCRVEEAKASWARLHPQRRSA